MEEVEPSMNSMTSEVEGPEWARAMGTTLVAILDLELLVEVDCFFSCFCFFNGDTLRSGVFRVERLFGMFLGSNKKKM